MHHPLQQHHAHPLCADMRTCTDTLKPLVLSFDHILTYSYLKQRCIGGYHFYLWCVNGAFPQMAEMRGLYEFVSRCALVTVITERTCVLMYPQKSDISLQGLEPILDKLFTNFTFQIGIHHTCNSTINFYSIRLLCIPIMEAKFPHLHST